MQLHRALLWGLFVSWCGMPLSVSASVIISEVAWMGSAENANAEWIELLNTSALDVDMEWWTLVAEDGQPSITLSGVLGAGRYALLERTSDETVPGIPAFFVYTGAMGNIGEVLVLRDAGGVVRDRVDGSGAWSIGGDNATKDTLQRTGEPATGAWVTAPRTPARGGATHAPPPARSQTDGALTGTRMETSVPQGNIKGNIKGNIQDTTTGTTPAPTHVASTPPVRPPPALTLAIGEDTATMAGSVSTYRARGYDEDGKEVALSRVRWNFGDGTVETGAQVKHAYRYAGRYVVVVHATRGVLEADARMVVEVGAFALEMPEANTERIVLYNAGVEEVDVTRFTLGVGTSHFQIPSGTVLLSGASVTFPASVTGLVANEGVPVGLFYPDTTLALLFSRATSAPLVQGGVVEGDEDEEEGDVSREVGDGEEEEMYTEERGVEETPHEPEQETKPSALSVAFGTPLLSSVSHAALREVYDEAGRSNTGGTRVWWWIVGGIAAILLGITVVAVVRDEEEEVIRGYLVEEEPEREI